MTGSSELRAITDVKNFLNNIGFLNWPNLAQDFSIKDINISTIFGNFIAFGTMKFLFLTHLEGNETQQDFLRVSKNCIIKRKYRKKYNISLLKLKMHIYTFNWMSNNAWDAWNIILFYCNLKKTILRNENVFEIFIASTFRTLSH